MKLAKKKTEKRTIEMRDMKNGDIGHIESGNHYVLRVGGGINSIWFILGDHSSCDYYDYLAAQYHKVKLLTKEEVLTVEFRGQA